MIIDDITIDVHAGNGGDGTVAFDKNMNAKGPAGGNGGNGGSIYIQGVSDLGALRQFRFKKEVQAEHGGIGRSQFRDGADGKDTIIDVPVGTVVHNLTTQEDIDITEKHSPILIAQGGRGGKGNFLFRSSKNTTPTQFQKGKEGESFTLRLELKFIADIGLVGLPNVGKSTLLNALTNAKSKVANYHFTTLEPHLGVFHNIIIADIPGLIEGASEGKGLGIKFLRHIERTRILFHLISAESENPLHDYTIIRNELKAHNPTLSEKKEYILITKKDLVPQQDLEKKLKPLQKKNPQIQIVSLENEDDIASIGAHISQAIESES